MKKILTMGIFIIALIAVLYILIKPNNSPEYALTQIRKAIVSRDYILFSQYVDLRGVVGSFIDFSTKEDANFLLTLTKPTLIDEFDEKIKDAMEKGQIDRFAKFGHIVSSKIIQKSAYIGIQFVPEYYALPCTLQIRFRRLKDNWQIAEFDFNDAFRQIKEIEKHKADSINNTIMAGINEDIEQISNEIEGRISSIRPKDNGPPSNFIKIKALPETGYTSDKGIDVSVEVNSDFDIDEMKYKAIFDCNGIISEYSRDLYFNNIQHNMIDYIETDFDPQSCINNIKFEILNVKFTNGDLWKSQIAGLQKKKERLKSAEFKSELYEERKVSGSIDPMTFIGRLLDFNPAL